MRKNKVINSKMIVVDLSTKDRLDKYMCDLCLPKMTYNEVIIWLLDIKDTILYRKEMEDLQKDIEYKEWIRKNK